ncbi:hypothetical protein LSTR_LSTR004695 [Laodelphax striatellus]|uniref:Uncharacterized protein n=1 Tax=Laodelphax striatellus TaxID=195883 RepID=A0A482WTU6_LAOST|nr:hypothetical protein LSTR_LSTR004695 [Laodelphax striatellus]
MTFLTNKKNKAKTRMSKTKQKWVKLLRRANTKAEIRVMTDGEDGSMLLLRSNSNLSLPPTASEVCLEQLKQKLGPEKRWNSDKLGSLESHRLVWTDDRWLNGYARRLRDLNGTVGSRKGVLLAGGDSSQCRTQEAQEI